jgi:hypothetical protein
VHNKKIELYRPLPILTSPYEGISMDLMNPCLSEWQGKDAILVVIDKFANLATCLDEQKP